MRTVIQFSVYDFIRLLLLLYLDCCSSINILCGMKKESIQQSIQKTGFWHVADGEWDEMKNRLGRGNR